MQLSQLVATMKNSNLDITRYCNIKSYLTIQNKIDCVQKYRHIVNEMLRDEKYCGVESLITFVVFNLIAIQAYTDIEFDISFESMDLLQSSGLIDKIIYKIGVDYQMLLQFVMN